MWILACNSLLYWFTFIYFYRKDGMCISTVLWLYYAIFSLFGALLMIDDMYFYVMGIPDKLKRLEKLSFEPYILLYLTFYLFVTPLRRVKMSNLNFTKIGIGHRTLRKIVRICCSFQVVYILIKLYQAYIVSQIGFGNFHDIQSENNGNFDAELFYSGILGGVLRLFNYAGRFINLVFMPTIVIYMTYMFCNKYISKKEFIWTIGIYVISLLLRGIVGGSRAIMFFSIMELLVYYFLFKDYIGVKFKRKIIKSFIIVLTGIIIITAFISIERNEGIGVTGSTPLQNVFRYLGEMWPNLGLEYWNRVEVHPYGEFLFSSFDLSGQNVSTKWFFKTGVHTWWFFTILGILYFEYGKIIAMLIIVFLAILIRMFLKKKTFQLCDMGLIVFIYNFCVSSLFGISLNNPISLFSLVSLIILYRLLKPKNKSAFLKNNHF